MASEEWLPGIMISGMPSLECRLLGDFSRMASPSLLKSPYIDVILLTRPSEGTAKCID